MNIKLRYRKKPSRWSHSDSIDLEDIKQLQFLKRCNGCNDKSLVLFLRLKMLQYILFQLFKCNRLYRSGMCNNYWSVWSYGTKENDEELENLLGVADMEIEQPSNSETVPNHLFGRRNFYHRWKSIRKISFSIVFI